MIDTNNKINDLKGFLSGILQFSDAEINVIKMCINYLHEQAPVEIPLIILKTNNLISASDDLAWVCLSVNRKINELEANIKRIKAPEFTALTRQGRPSSTAIEYEILHNHDELADMEEMLGTLQKFYDYLKHIEKSIDRYLWMLRDSGNFNK